MKIICSCGNEFDFEKSKNCNNEGQMEHFQFIVGENHIHGEYLMLTCNNCDKTILLTNPEYEED